jgi:hypothetical protein
MKDRLILHRGDKGAGVRTVQEALGDMGFPMLVLRGDIEEWSRERVNVTDVARHVGCDVTALRRSFLAEYWHHDVQVPRVGACAPCHSADLDETMSVAHLATAVGYESEKNFYEVVRPRHGYNAGGPSGAGQVSP